MKVGIALNMLTQEGRPDAAVLGDHLALGDLAEPLGFDSLFALEHHFTGYAMSPSPTQLLSYFAGRTKRVTLGTAVIVLPWHDPVRIAEEIALLDILSGGRCLLGFGGAPQASSTGSGSRWRRRAPASSRPRRSWSGRSARDVFEWDGEFFKIPRTSIRPRPISHPERRIYASSVSPESAEIMAKLGFGVLVIMQNEWPKAAEDIQRYREVAQSVGHTPRPPIILTNVSVAESRTEAHERAVKYLSRKFDSIDTHYRFSDGHLGSVKGYESYGATAKTYAKMKDANFRQKAADFYVKIQVVGTPDECLQQLVGAPPADRPRPPGHRVRLRRHAAPRGRAQHAPLRRSRHAGAPAGRGVRGAGGVGTERGVAGRSIRGNLRAGLIAEGRPLFPDAEIGTELKPVDRDGEERSAAIVVADLLCPEICSLLNRQIIWAVARRNEDGHEDEPGDEMLHGPEPTGRARGGSSAAIVPTVDSTPPRRSGDEHDRDGDGEPGHADDERHRDDQRTAGDQEQEGELDHELSPPTLGLVASWLRY